MSKQSYIYLGIIAQILLISIQTRGVGDNNIQTCFSTLPFDCEYYCMYQIRDSSADIWIEYNGYNDFCHFYLLDNSTEYTQQEYNNMLECSNIILQHYENQNMNEDEGEDYRTQTYHINRINCIESALNNSEFENDYTTGETETQELQQCYEICQEKCGLFCIGEQLYNYDNNIDFCSDDIFQKELDAQTEDYIQYEDAREIFYCNQNIVVEKSMTAESLDFLKCKNLCIANTVFNDNMTSFLNENEHWQGFVHLDNYYLDQYEDSIVDKYCYDYRCNPRKYYENSNNHSVEYVDKAFTYNQECNYQEICESFSGGQCLTDLNCDCYYGYVCEGDQNSTETQQFYIDNFLLLSTIEDCSNDCIDQCDSDCTVEIFENFDYEICQDYYDSVEQDIGNDLSDIASIGLTTAQQLDQCIQDNEQNFEQGSSGYNTLECQSVCAVDAINAELARRKAQCSGQLYKCLGEMLDCIDECQQNHCPDLGCLDDVEADSETDFKQYVLDQCPSLAYSLQEHVDDSDLGSIFYTPVTFDIAANLVGCSKDQEQTRTSNQSDKLFQCTAKCGKHNSSQKLSFASYITIAFILLIQFGF